MMSSWAVKTSRSTADWRGEGRPSWRATRPARGWRQSQWLPCGAVPRSARRSRWSRCGVQWLEREVIDDEQLDVGEATHLGLDTVVEPGGFEPLKSLSARAMSTVCRQRTAMWPSAVAR